MTTTLPDFLIKKIEAFVPKYTDVKFDNDESFRAWLNEVTDIEIVFEDQGQDLMRFYVAENSEIVHVELPQLGNIYNGALLLDDNDFIMEGDYASLYIPQFDEPSQIKYLISQIIYKK